MFAVGRVDTAGEQPAAEVVIETFNIIKVKRKTKCKTVEIHKNVEANALPCHT